MWLQKVYFLSIIPKARLILTYYRRWSSLSRRIHMKPSQNANPSKLMKKQHFSTHHLQERRSHYKFIWHNNTHRAKSLDYHLNFSYSVSTQCVNTLLMRGPGKQALNSMNFFDVYWLVCIVDILEPLYMAFSHVTKLA